MPDQTAAVSTVADDALRTAMAEVEKQYTGGKMRTVYRGAKFVNDKKAAKSAVSQIGVPNKYEELSNRKSLYKVRQTS